MRLKRLFLYGLVVLFLPLITEGADLLYVLPEGHPYSAADFKAVPNRESLLRFGNRIEGLWAKEIDGVTWYYCYRENAFFFLPEIVVSGNPPPTTRDARGDIPIGHGPVDRDLPLPLNYRPSDLVPVLTGYKARGYERREMLLRREAVKVFERLIDHAENEGVNIRMISAFRDAAYQAQLYAAAIERNGFFQNSVAKPGHSEHQLGTVVDLTTAEIGGGLSASFENTTAFRWLKEHRIQYGISLSYPKYKIEVTGYIYEPWHYRYLGENLWLRQEYNPFAFYTR
jgi:D-alanyl-D-alanine carboxypeptidase